MRGGARIVLEKVRSGWVGLEGRFELGAWQAEALGFGGWSLSGHHVFDAVGQRLLLGDGGRKSAHGLPPVVYRAAGTGEFGFGGDGGPAPLARLKSTSDLAFGADGSLYIADTESDRIRRVSRQGVIATVAGTGQECRLEDGEEVVDCGDGGPATAARLRSPEGVSVGPDGSLYIADTGNRCIRRVTADGIIATVAGLCDAGTGAEPQSLVTGVPTSRIHAVECDDCLAIGAELHGPRAVVVAPDGGFFFAEPGQGTVRSVGPDGFLSTYAGGGLEFPADGTQATAVELRQPYGLALGPDGSLYIAQPRDNVIRQVRPDGRLTAVVGDPDSPFCSPSSGPCLEFPTDVAVAPDGSLLIADTDNRLLRSTGRDGRLRTIAGRDSEVSASGTGDGSAAGSWDLEFVEGVAVAPDGLVHFGQGTSVLRLSGALTGFLDGETPVPAPGGGEIYVFDPQGRHLRTVDPLTGVERMSFSYEEGRLTAMRDQDGKQTRIERRADGRATAIVGPFGQRTTFRYGPDGYLAEVENPAGETWSFVYEGDGLLTRMVDPRARARNYEHQGFGRLVRAEDPAGGSKTLARTANPASNLYRVDVTTALGRTTGHTVSRPRPGESLRIRQNPSGALTTRRQSSDGRRSTLTPDGSFSTLDRAPDPRWGLLAPLPGALTVATPGGLVSQGISRRAVLLADPDDPFSLTTQLDDVTMNGRTYTREYDAATRRFTLTTPEGRQRFLTIDAKGRPARSEAPGLAAIEFSYDAFGRMSGVAQGTGADRRALIFAYRPDGFLGQVTDPLGRSVTFEVDPAGRVTGQTLPDGRAIGFAYEPGGALASLVPPGGQAHNFTTTPVDLPATYEPPALPGQASVTSYDYSLDKEPLRIARPDGRDVTATFDAAGRLASLGTPDATLTFARVPSTDQLASVATSDGSGLSYTYDGFLPTSTTWSGAVAGTVERTYDADLRIRTRRVNGIHTIPFDYDRDGLLTPAGDLVLDRHPATGLLTGTILGTVTTAQSYNPFAEVDSWSASVAGQAALAVTVQRDRLGRIVEKAETEGGTTTTTGYAYDLAGRLTDVTRDGVLVGHYEFDANGSRTAYSGQFGTAAATYDAQDRLLTYGDLAFTYTAAGELLTKTQGSQTVDYHYDPLGNLRSVDLPDGVRIDYLIDGAQRRIGKKVQGTLVQGFLYQDGLKPIAELDGEGEIVALFVYGTRPNVPEYMVKGVATYRIVADHLGSPRLVIDTETGEVAQRMEFDEFGRVLHDSNPGLQPFGFAGGLYDRQTGLVRFGARDYDPEIGRWTAVSVYRSSDGRGGWVSRGVRFGGRRRVRVVLS